jgi:glycosyltransferase involved in cell wall biosynthesis
MKTLITLIGAQTGSVANYSLLFRAWAEEFPGDELVIFCNREVARYYESRLRFSGLPNVHVISWHTGLFKEPLRLWFHTLGLRRYIRRYSPDVILSISVGPYLATKVPQVIQVNNAFQVCDWSLMRYHPRNRFHVAMMRFFFRLSLAKCDAAIVQTEGMRKLLASIPCSPEHMAVISKSVETERELTPHPLPEYIRQQLAADSSRKKFTYLYVATCSPHKNHITLIRAMEFARAQKSSLRLVLTITKKELERLAGREAKMARSLVESGHIIILGWITKNLLQNLYNACSGCVMPSVLESMSSSHLEAMRWNKPQISSDVSCHRDLCGDASLYVPTEDPRAWFEEMERLAGDPALQADLVEKGAKRIVDFPQSWLKVAKKYRSFFEEVICWCQKTNAKHTLPLITGILTTMTASVPEFPF